MTRTTRPLRGLLVGATAVALVLPPATAVAQEPDPTADAAAWLVDQLVAGDHLEGESGTQYGPTADVALGLLATGEQPDALADVLAFMTTPEAVDAYVHGEPFESTTNPDLPDPVEDPTYVGANAKLGFLVTTAGRDPRSVGGDDLVENMLSLEEDSGAFEDRSRFGSYANVFGQSLALLFLTAAEDVSPSAASVDYLVEAQCEDGGFPEQFDTEDCESDADATGLALQALLATFPADGGADVLGEAARWLVHNRDAEGAHGGAGSDQNVNSTGYAGMALLADGRPFAASREFLVRAQNPDGGLPITPGGESDPFATAQALPLLGHTAFLDLVEGVPTRADRIAGENRRLTAVEVSQASFGDGAAATVVLTRDDLFADALAGTPLAVEVDGPLLTTSPDGMDDDVLAEIQRVLPEGGEVLVLGGGDALPASVDEDLQDAGYETRRISGATRFETSVEIARELGDPQRQLLTTGLEFADALTAGTAAAATGGAVLLTDGTTPHEAVTTYLDETDGERIAVGGPAASAYPDAEDLVGTNREATAVLVAERFFTAPRAVGVARLDVFADALAGGVYMASSGGPLVLTATTELPDVTASYLCEIGDDLARTTVFGGTVAIDDTVVGSIRDRVAGSGC